MIEHNIPVSLDVSYINDIVKKNMNSMLALSICKYHRILFF